MKYGENNKKIVIVESLVNKITKFVLIFKFRDSLNLIDTIVFKGPFGKKVK